MSYQVLARKWRPKNFHEMVGQEHVLKALINALDNNRLHHAYLFTGTRGVGKTTIARILAKCLNCETGVTSKPCGVCSSCQEINEGRFVDLIEVDAASRTKVEDTRELLENVQYAPSRGRYKVYLIDEVHMLSGHSFNALLKTLEEPPPHVKFLLATTDPQKLPITVLSRCLQFSLKNMSPERIVGHLQHVLAAEQVEFEEPALWQLGRAADGSMRDAMSLTDQAIAYGQGRVAAADVAAMLGTLDQRWAFALVEALARHDVSRMLQQVAALAELAPDYQGVLADVLSLLHRIALAQVMPDGIDNSQGDRDSVLALAQLLPAEDVQLFYQIALTGRKDLPLSPDARQGLEMALLRMLAFRPRGVAVTPGNGAVQIAPPSVQAATPAAVVEGAELKKPETAAMPAVMQQTDQVSPAVMTAPQPTASAPSSVPVSKEAAPVVLSSADSQAGMPVGNASGGPEPGASVDTARPVTEQVLKETSVTPRTPIPDTERRATVVAPANAARPAGHSPDTAGAPPFDTQVPLDAYSDYQSGASYAAAMMDAGEDEDDSEPGAMLDQAVYQADYLLSQLSSPEVVSAEAALDEADAEEEPDVASHEPAFGYEQISLETWPLIAQDVPIRGVLRAIVEATELVRVSAEGLELTCEDQQHSLFSARQQSLLEEALADYFKRPVRISCQSSRGLAHTATVYKAQARALRQQQAETAIHNDATLHALLDAFEAIIQPGSIKPVELQRG
ncbi:DNA polymerase III subunit gamma/tau [Pokkaliibacter plantistimulans]|uniref:DNA polymerase III subunit gamma/tau n=1 Tax=Proteobacteria bacterium 228 TaxID=2083153 RepID=A0A2S5KP37_9PROT|nr:DNA polymerase III subunit gamma/tau [Pokkaliibacter plantistimulans]PPC76056.1 DNA polymerase III subunit gamma/tau [Pokkaliibacter plantistimulans]